MTAVPLVSLFAIPKAFTGLTAIQQRNAILSWLQLGDEVEVTLIGDDPGTADIARELHIRHVGEIARDQASTPLVSSVFDAGLAMSRAPVACYINADIILLPDFLTAVRNVPFQRFLLLGRRWDLPLNSAIDFTSRSWRAELQTRVQQQGRLHSVTGIDYFAFTRGWLQPMPDFAIGRTIWDNWIVFRARARGVPIIDSTSAISAIHQNHDYGHIEGGIQVAWTGPQALRNRSLADDMLYPFTIADANWRLGPEGVRRKLSPSEMLRQIVGWAAIRFGRNRTIGHWARQAGQTLRQSR